MERKFEEYAADIVGAGYKCVACGRSITREAALLGKGGPFCGGSRCRGTTDVDRKLQSFEEIMKEEPIEEDQQTEEEHLFYSN